MLFFNHPNKTNEGGAVNVHHLAQPSGLDQALSSSMANLTAMVFMSFKPIMAEIVATLFHSQLQDKLDLANSSHLV